MCAFVGTIMVCVYLCVREYMYIYILDSCMDHIQIIDDQTYQLT